MQMRPRREAGRAHVADDLLLTDALPHMHPRREPREVAVAGPNAVGVADLDQVAVAAVAAGDHDDAVGGGADRRPVRGRIIGPLMGPPAPENRMKAPAEAARDMTEAQRRPQERTAQRTPLVVVEGAGAVRVLETKCEAGRARDFHPCRENTAEPLLPCGRIQPLDENLDPIAG